MRIQKIENPILRQVVAGWTVGLTPSQVARITGFTELSVRSMYEEMDKILHQMTMGVGWKGPWDNPIDHGRKIEQ